MHSSTLPGYAIINPYLRNQSFTMSSVNTSDTTIITTVQPEPIAARAFGVTFADDIYNVSDNVMDTEYNGELVDYNDEYVMATINQKAAKVALRNSLIRNGFAISIRQLTIAFKQVHEDSLLYIANGE
jgi:hypothetical protein